MVAEEHEVCVSSCLSSLTDIAEFVAERAAAAGLDADQVYDVQTAVDEACTNAIQYAYAGREDGELRVCCFEEGDAFVVRITDYGAPFDPSTVQEPDLTTPLEDRAIGGLGVYLMRQLMDEVVFASDQAGANEVVMRKARGGAR